MKVIEMSGHNGPSSLQGLFWFSAASSKCLKYLVPTRRVGMQCRTRCVPYFASSQASDSEFSVGSSRQPLLRCSTSCIHASRSFQSREAGVSSSSFPSWSLGASVISTVFPHATHIVIYIFLRFPSFQLKPAQRLECRLCLQAQAKLALLIRNAWERG
jgi:hypothetical protein